MLNDNLKHTHGGRRRVGRPAAVLAALVLALTILLGPGPGPGLTPAWAADTACETSFDTGLTYEWWENEWDDCGIQTAVPLRAGIACGDFNLRLLGAYVSTRVDPARARDSHLSAFVDTRLNLTYEIVDRLPVDILFGLGLNLPTGRTDLKPRELGLLVVPDLFTITTFGEGLNYNPVVTIAKAWDRLQIGFGAGYAWRGEYDYSYAVKNFDPGDVLNLSAEAAYDLGAGWEARLFGEYAAYGSDQVYGLDSYEEGDYRRYGAALNWRGATWEAGLRLSAVKRDKARFRYGLGLLANEADNSHGDEWAAELDTRFQLDDATSLQLLAAWLHLDANDYPATSINYFGRRDKLSLGLGLAHRLRDDLTLAGKLQLYQMDDQRNWYHPTLSYDYLGLAAGLNVLMHF